VSNTDQLALFVPQPIDTPSGPPPRSTGKSARGAAEYVEISPGTWAVCVFGLIPKNGFSGLDFPHYWGGPQESPRWRVARHRDVPDGTFIFATATEAQEVVAEAFGGVADLGPFMGWIQIPSDDLRRRAADLNPPDGAS
jgi:hypothetical protein